MSDGSARLLAGLLETRTGQQLQVGRRWRIELALRPLIARHGLAGADELVTRIAGGRDPALADAVIDALLNNETSFFRDVRSFDLLAGRGFARLARERAERRRLAIWCAGCSTGQEAYSLAMLFADDAERWSDWTIDIVATDVSAGAIETARAGRYSHFEIQRGLPVTRMIRWFVQDGDRWQANDALRRLVRFRRLSLLDLPPPPGRFDIILCRNVLIYFSAQVRRVVFDRLAGAIAADGLLMLGAGETVLGQTEAFVSDYECRGLYRPIVPADPARAA